MSERLLRPQPVGIVPIPVGLLVLPDVAGASSALLHEILHGPMPAELPETWVFYRAAHAGDLDATLRELQEDVTDVGRYNRFVLQPSASELKVLRETLSGDLRVLLAATAYAVGLSDDSPEVGHLEGELAALVLMVRAAAQLEREAPEAAISDLHAAVALVREISPLFAAQLLTQLASIYRSLPEPLPSQAPAVYRDALALLENADIPELTTELWMQLAMTCQETARGRVHLLEEAIRGYQEVLRSKLVPEEHSELFALAHNNLGLVFLSMPMSEEAKKLRLGIAVQSFREALRLVDREAQASLWGSIQMNLANALQHLPSSHPEENLAQAVDLYEELITVGRKAFDPVGYAKLLSNQANALAHLGIFSPALEKLQEARKLFEWHGESELASASMELVSEIHGQIGNRAPAQTVVGEA
jgi:tetratricopeptide (TPR) repeat protein